MGDPAGATTDRSGGGGRGGGGQSYGSAPSALYRTRHPIRAISEVQDGEAHPPGALHGMLESLAQLKDDQPDRGLTRPNRPCRHNVDCSCARFLPQTHLEREQPTRSPVSRIGCCLAVSSRAHAEPRLSQCQTSGGGPRQRPPVGVISSSLDRSQRGPHPKGRGGIGGSPRVVVRGAVTRARRAKASVLSG